MNIKIMVAAHKKFPMPSDTDLYLPVLVGANKNFTQGIVYQRDDEGDNISDKNSNYNELTALYWAWKNLDADVIGLVHYRRYFSLQRERNLNHVLNKEEVINLLKKAPIILPKMRNYYIESNYSHYVHAHHKEPLHVTREVIKKKFPNDLASFDKVMTAKKAHMFNMMIMKKKYFDEYVKWLFDILFEVEERIDIKEYSVQEARVFGYLSELLMDVWLKSRDLKYVETNWIQLGDRKLISKASNFLFRKFNISNKRTHF